MLKKRTPEEIRSILKQEVTFQFAKSSGPGGQNVNKVNSKAIAYWHFQESALLTPFEKQKCSEKCGNRINKDGVYVISSDEFRDRPKNQDKCLEKLVGVVAFLKFRPKKRIPSQPSRGSIEKRIQGKKQNAEKKKLRNKVQL